MRDRIERLVLLPFSMGCVSESSTAVGSDHHQFPNRSNRRYSNNNNNNNNSAPTSIHDDEEEEEEEEESEEESSSEENLKSFLGAPKFQRLFKNFKNISHLFGNESEDGEDGDEDEEEGMGMGMEMEIGFPTDVKHVTHIGIDGSTTSILSKGWDKQPQFNNNNIQTASDDSKKAPNTMKMMMMMMAL